MTTCERCGEINPAEIHTCTPKPELKQRTGNCLLTGVCAAEGHHIRKAQREWQGLTKGETDAAYKEMELNYSYVDFAIAIEAKLKQKNA
jgi:hypothetical protein